MRRSVEFNTPKVKGLPFFRTCSAAKRAIALGYTHVAWYPDGTDGWAADQLPLESRTPLPRPQATE